MAQVPDQCYFVQLTEELLLHVAEYISVNDLLRFHCVNKELSMLNTDTIWKLHCRQRWSNWPRYKLTPAREAKLDTAEEARMSSKSQSKWKERYRIVEELASCQVLAVGDLVNLRWYLCFIIPGGRGERRSELIPIEFRSDGYLIVPNYPPLTYQIHHCHLATSTTDSANEQQPSPSRRMPSSEHISSKLYGDRPFSQVQFLQIANFPPHFISRQRWNAEWMICNENVIIFSTGDKEE
jgi:hypothetical protein